jgi:hypothetical protein
LLIHPPNIYALRKTKPLPRKVTRLFSRADPSPAWSPSLRLGVERFSPILPAPVSVVAPKNFDDICCRYVDCRCRQYLDDPRRRGLPARQPPPLCFVLPPPLGLQSAAARFELGSRVLPLCLQAAACSCAAGLLCLSAATGRLLCLSAATDGGGGVSREVAAWGVRSALWSPATEKKAEKIDMRPKFDFFEAIY